MIYRHYWPAIVHALAIASITMYGLEWWRLSLAEHFTQQDQAIEIESMQAALRKEQEKRCTLKDKAKQAWTKGTEAQGNTATQGKSWWRIW